MFDLLPLNRRRGSSTPGIFSDMDDMVKRLWFNFPFHNLQDDMDITWTPRLDVSETDTHLEIVGDLPGIKKEEIQVFLEENLLTIKGERKEEKETKGRQFHTIERRGGSFYRALRLPVDVERDKIDANFKDGVLTLRLPKSKEVKRKTAQIDIK